MVRYVQTVAIHAVATQYALLEHGKEVVAPIKLRLIVGRRHDIEQGEISTLSNMTTRSERAAEICSDLAQ